MEARAQESLEISEGEHLRESSKYTALAIQASIPILTLCAAILAIVGIIQCANLRKDHDSLVLQMEKLIHTVQCMERNLNAATKSDEGLSENTVSMHSQIQKSEHVSWASIQVELKNIHRIVKILTEVVTVPMGQRSAAVVPHPNVSAELSTSQTVSCASGGEPLISCLWARSLNGQRKVIVVDNEVVGGGGRTNVDGTFYVAGDGLSMGNCSLQIESFTKDDAGSWSCTLISQNGKIYTGQVLVTAKEIEPRIYFATDEGTIQTYSMATSRVNTVVNSSDWFLAITYDSIRDKIYWSSENMIYRANRSGSKRKSVLATYKYGTIYALAFDWIVGNVYAATWNGLILACNVKTGTFTCATVLIDRGPLRGLALNPNGGFMYWTREDKSNGTVGRAEMDGSGPVTLVAGLKRPRGIVVDYEASRLYWNCRGDETIQTSDLHGSDHHSVIQLASGSWPYGIGVLNGRLYWTTFSSKTLQCCTKSGSDLQTLIMGKEHGYHLVVIPVLNDSLVGNRTNHCEKRGCAEVCVLTAASFRCVT